jgi:hypothetical protein
MRAHLAFERAADDRIELHGEVAPREVGRLLAAHDVVAIPSLWECWPAAAAEALRHGRPVLAAPVGGLTAFVRPGVSGFLARDASEEALREALEPLVRAPAQVRELAASGGPRAVFEELGDPAGIRRRYEWMVSDWRAPAPPRLQGAPPLVSVIVGYHDADAALEAALRSVAAQTYPAIETIVVNDGSMREQDRVLEDLAARYDFTLLIQRSRGPGAARNFGVRQARGRFVLPLAADQSIAPEFVERCVYALLADRDIAYVGTWARPADGAEGGSAPLGNWSALLETQNVAGGAAAMLRRHLFDTGFAYSHELAGHEDWLLHLQLRQAGQFGAIIPRALLHYSANGSSTPPSPRAARLEGEVRALLAESAMQWTSRNA